MDKITILTQIMLHLAEIKMYYLRKFVSTQAEAVTIQTELAAANGTSQKELIVKLTEVEKNVETERTLLQRAVEAYEQAFETYTNYVTAQLPLQTNS